jgi:hypothetical protein
MALRAMREASLSRSPKYLHQEIFSVRNKLWYRLESR